MSKQEAVLMSTSNDLSSILTNVNWAVYRNTYQNGEAEPLPTQPTVPGLVVNDPEQTSASTQFLGGLLGQSKWYQLSPHQWTKQHVLEWMGHHVDENEFDASTLNLVGCSMDGPTLCQLSHSTLLSMFGSLGERLYHHLQELKTKFGAEDLTVAWDMLNDLWEDLPDFLNVHAGDDYKLLSTVVVHGEERGPDLCSHIDGLKTVGDKTPLSDNGYESGSTLSDSWNTRMLSFPVPSSPESVGSDSESDMQFSAKGFIKTERGELKPHKRGRGRPRKLSRGSGQVIETTKSKHSPRGAHLWEFIRDILIHPEQNNGLMKWEDRTEGVFKFLKSEAVAQLWGQKKRNSSMTYEKLSRAMRYYYKREILERVDGRRLVYKFGKNSRGWKLEEAGI